MPTFAWLALTVSVLLVSGHLIGSQLLKFRKRDGFSITEIKDEIEIRKNIYVILGGGSFIITAIFSLNEMQLKYRSEDRSALYNALSQLVAVDQNRPEISAAALLQLGRLGALSVSERPSLVQIVSAYLNERGNKSIKEHKRGGARADIQVALSVLSELIAIDENLGSLVVLRDVDLRFVRLERAALRNTTFSQVDFSQAYLQGADFSGARIDTTLFNDATVIGAVFASASIDKSEFVGADVKGANFCGVRSHIGARFESVKNGGDARCLPK